MLSAGLSTLVLRIFSSSNFQSQTGKHRRVSGLELFELGGFGPKLARVQLPRGGCC